MTSMIEDRSGNIVICGEGVGQNSSSDTLYHDGGCLLKFDKNGNTIFYQVYDYDTSWLDILNDITETADGGYACVGNAFDHGSNNTNYQRAWLLKVDSNGCLNGNCPTLHTAVNEIPDPMSFFVFPNPVSSQFTVALAGPQDIYRYHDLTFTLYDLTGRLVYSQPLTQQTTVIQRDGLSDGLYIWELSNGNEHITNGKIAFR